MYRTLQLAVSWGRVDVLQEVSFPSKVPGCVLRIPRVNFRIVRMVNASIVVLQEV